MSRNASCHYVYPEEISALREREQSVLIYHHLSRRESSDIQMQSWLSILGDDALGFRFRLGGSRAFFLLPAASHQDLLIYNTSTFMETPWKEHFTLYGKD